MEHYNISGLALQKSIVIRAFVTFKELALYRENNCLNARAKWFK